jgi:hypothetical protein
VDISSSVHIIHNNINNTYKNIHIYIYIYIYIYIHIHKLHIFHCSTPKRRFFPVHICTCVAVVSQLTYAGHHHLQGKEATNSISSIPAPERPRQATEDCQGLFLLRCSKGWWGLDRFRLFTTWWIGWQGQEKPRNRSTTGHQRIVFIKKVDHNYGQPFFCFNQYYFIFLKSPIA